MKTLAIFSFLCSTTVAFSAERTWDGWQIGDLIVQETKGIEADALRKATASRYTHIGILRPTGGGYYVMETTEKNAFWEIPVESFISRGIGQRFAVFRYPRLDEHAGYKIMMAAFEFEYAPYDKFYRLEPSSIYAAELAYDTFRKIGVTLGKPLPALKAGFGVSAAMNFLLQDWRNNPDCVNKSREQCWSKLRNKLIVTPASIVADPRLKLVHSTFD